MAYFENISTPRISISNNIIDAKTKIMLYEKQTYKVNPTLYGNDTIFNKISYREVKQNDKNSFPVVLHDIRRRYMNLYTNKNEKLEKTYIKKLLVLIKCILNYYDIFSYGYDKTFTKFKLFNPEQILRIIIKKYYLKNNYR